VHYDIVKGVYVTVTWQTRWAT